MKRSRTIASTPFAVLVAFSLIGGATPVFADTASSTTAPVSSTDLTTGSTTAPAGQLTQDQAVQIAEKLLNISSDYTLQGSNYFSGSNYNPQATWNLNWQTSSDGGVKPVHSINVTIDATNGTLLSYNN